MSAKLPGCAAPDLGSIVTLMAMLDRAFGGSIARKLRAVLPDLGLKAEKEVVTEVRNRVIIVEAMCVIMPVGSDA